MYCVLNLGWTPSQFIRLSYKEKIFVTASVMMKIEEEKKQQRKANIKKPSVRRR